MLRSLFILMVYLTIMGLGMSAPFVFTLGYVWVDMFRPGDIVYPFLRIIPYALLMGVAALGSYFLVDRRDPPRIGSITVLTLVFAFWITLTTLWAFVPEFAWIKWDWAVKTVLFSAFIPFVIRSRNHIEALLQVLVFSLAANLIPFGAKTFLTGGGYNRALGLMNRNYFLGEAATLATAALLIVPIIIFLISHSRIMPRNIWTRLGYIGLIVLALATAIGTHERTALVGLAVLALVQWWKSRKKLLFLALTAMIGLGIFYTAPESWYERMSTISAASEDSTDPAAMDVSAGTRLAVWDWTLRFVSVYPQGGGFEVYRINRIALINPVTRQVEVQSGRAFHSMFFEVLGEHGWLGLGLLLSLVFCSIRALRQAARLSRKHPHLLWSYDLANALQVSMAILLSCGVFTGFGFQPFIWDLFALSVALQQYVQRVLVPREAAVQGAREGLALAHTG